jgi:hypothetical protein
MTWTYTGDPATNARDSVRFLIGDTDTNDQLINDEEIAWINNQLTGSDTATTALYNVAYRACITIASKFSRMADKSVGDLRVSMSQKAKAYREQADSLLLLAGREGSVPTPYAGGISIADKDVDQGDSDIVEPSFSFGQFDNSRGGADSVVANFGVGADT